MTPTWRELILAGAITLFVFAALQKQVFNPIWPNRRTLIVAVILTLLFVAALPIWHRHGDVGGRMHGHAIWDGGHVH